MIFGGAVAESIALDAKGVGFKSQRSAKNFKNHFECDFSATLSLSCIQYDEHGFD